MLFLRPLFFFRPTATKVEAKLTRAKERREKASRELELSLIDKNEQAFQRAQEYRNERREKFRKKNKKVKKVNERHSLLENKRRKNAMHSIENRLNSALSRAEENLKKRQKRARRSKRLERAQNKRALIEFERRSALLASVGHRSERAARNLQLRLEDLQGKARDEIQHVQDVAKRVKAARILQKIVREKLGFKDHNETDETKLSMTTAALRFQNCVSWRTKVVESRLSNFESLRNLIAAMGFQNSEELITDATFEQLTLAITNSASIESAKNILGSFEPLLRTSNLTKRDSISARTLLSVFLVVAQPDEVLAEKRGKDKCSKLLEKSAQKLVRSLLKLAGLESSVVPCYQRCGIIQEVASNIMSYCTLFDKWKNADLDELVDKMAKNAHHSWVAYLTSKEALIYIEENFQNQNGLFQHGTLFLFVGQLRLLYSISMILFTPFRSI